MNGGEKVIEFEEIYKKHFRDVYRYILSLTHDEHIAEEITQETFLKALKSIEQFDGRCQLYVWLCQIAKNTYFTSRKRTIKENTLVDDDSLNNSDSIEEKVLSQETIFEIHKVLHKLDEPYKEVFSLRVFGELSFRQIGELFGKTESWARVTYHRAKIKIKEGLQ